ncbi:MAG TPA: hypothetical protein ENO00_02475 [Deltaproteobacteria bacterium]|nr:hypothetical protein [Deltaproteobacteria bacterium]
MSRQDNALEKTQEDIFRERAMVLARAGESVHGALEKLRQIQAIIDEKLRIYHDAVAGMYTFSSSDSNGKSYRSLDELYNDINNKIREYNKTREHAKLRYYYLIVTREAMGFRRHRMVEELYKIPSKKEYMKRREWTNSLNRE